MKNRKFSSNNGINSNINNNSINTGIIPISRYVDIYENRFIIYKENNNKSGIYIITNKINNNIYIGSSLSLTNRFRTYLSVPSMQTNIKHGSSNIYSALLNYGYNNFILEILEYCEPDVLIDREQHYIDKLKPEYNILKTAGSRLGHKQSEKTKQLISIANKGKKRK